MRDGKLEKIDGRLNGIQWRALRTLLLALGAVYLAFAAREFYGAWVADHPSTENVKRAIGWVPGDPRVLRIYARRLTTDTLEAEPAVTFYLRAAHANPVDFENWEGLATAYQMLGEAKRAEQVLRTGLALVPYSPQAAWRLANLLILDRREKEALPYLRSAARANPSMRPAVFDLQWRLFGDPGLVLSSLLPCDADVLYSYLTFLIDRRKLTGSYEAWRELHRRNPSRAGELSDLYLDWLANAGLGKEAAAVWRDVLRDSGREAARPDGELVTNGDFEFDIVNAGLDWRIEPGSGYELSLDNFALHHGSRSLALVFDGTSNVSFSALWQFLPLEPDRAYRFQGWMKTENVNTDKGVAFCVSTLASPPQETFSVCSENRIGSNPWHEEDIDFRTGKETRFVKISLVRPASSQLDGRVSGKVWIDDLSLAPKEQ